jgi:hypothetical protein
MPQSDRYSYRGRTGGLLSVSSDQTSATSVSEPFYEALVIDVILDQFHPEYSTDAYNVGTIKIRLFTQDHSKSDELLNWAYPMDATIQEMPLIGELVLVNKVLGNFFYSRKVYIAHRIQENSMINLNKIANDRSEVLRNKIPSGEKEISLDKHKFGNYFKPDSRVRPLKHFEGDVIIQGRMGHSIRFGSSQMQVNNKGMAPNIIMRAGQAKDVETKACTAKEIFGLILEDPDLDASSIWMTSDQIIPYEQITKDAGSHFRSLVKQPQFYDGASILINSDRIILGSKKTHIFMFSNEEIYMNSYKNTSIDTDSSIILTANIDVGLYTGRTIEGVADVDFRMTTGKDVFMLSMEKMSMLSTKIFIGSTDTDEEPMVGGASLSKWLARLIHVLMGNPPAVTPWTTQKTTIAPPATPGIATQLHVITPTGPGVLNPAIVAGLTLLYSELVKPNSGQKIPSPFAGAPFNAGDNFVALSNDVVEMQKNNFKDGKQGKIENNTWVLKDQYYKVI